MGKKLILLLLTTITIIGLAGCAQLTVQPASTPETAISTNTPFISPMPRATVTATQTIPTMRAVLRPTFTPQPVGCKEPLDDYSLVYINDFAFNKRTVSMLQHAAELYQGKIDVAGGAITQGSFHDNGAASFGTHLGGGAVDISVMQAGTYTVLYDEIEPLIEAMRLAGFAAWLRDFNELYSGSAIHIHAIAIGDKQLSDAAKLQLTGFTGYFRGFDGLPTYIHPPRFDRHGGPIICKWMLEAGYKDLRPPANEIE